MATLSGKTTAGLPAWVKYVKNNPKWRELVLKIENKMVAPVYNPLNPKEQIENLPSGTQFKLTTQNLYQNTYAQVMYIYPGYRSKRGLIPINRIRKPTNTDVLKEETLALEKLDKRIKQIVKEIGPFELTIKGDPRKRVFKNVTGAKNVTAKILGREAKSDFNITGTKGDLIYISHKKAGGAEAFQQYGGLSEKAGVKIHTHPEVIDFLKKTGEYIKDGQLTKPVYTYVKDNDLINMAVFGHDYSIGTGVSKYGIDNVTIIGQGEAIIKCTPKNDERCILDFVSHLVHNGNSAKFKTGDYRAVLGATYRAGRGFIVEGNRYNGARVGIYPEKLIIGRTDASEI